MKPRGVKKVFQDELGRFIAVCNDGSMWISREISPTGNAMWRLIDPVPKRDYEGEA